MAPPVFVTTPSGGGGAPAPTLGPWRLHQDGLAVFGANGQQVFDADICSANISSEERRANARLISAATELLGALKALSNPLHDCETSSECAVLIARGDAVSCALIVRARQAIAKAEGACQPPRVEIDTADLVAVYAHDCANPQDCPACKQRHAKGRS
jgi:hypothetical protein